VAVPDAGTITRNPEWFEPNLMAAPELVKAQAGELQKFAQDNIQKDYATAGLLAQLKQALDVLPNAGKVSKGAFAAERAHWAHVYNTIASAWGMQQVDEKNVGTVEEAQRLSAGIALGALGRMGGRSSHVFGTVMGTVPGAEMSPEGSRRAVAGMTEVIHRDQDYYNAMQQWISNSRGSVKGFNKWFEDTHPAEMYAARAEVSALGISYNDIDKLVRNPSVMVSYTDAHGGQHTAPASQVFAMKYGLSQQSLNWLIGRQ
jgi:hypothetical protein